MEFSNFQQAVFETIAEEIGTTPEAIHEDFIKFCEKVDKLVEEGYTEEEAELIVSSTWVPVYLQ